VLLESGIFLFFLHLFPVHCAISPFPLSVLQVDHAARTRITIRLSIDVPHAGVLITRQHPDFRIVSYQTLLRPAQPSLHVSAKFSGAPTVGVIYTRLSTVIHVVTSINRFGRY